MLASQRAHYEHIISFLKEYNTITDYHQNEIAPITPTHVERWLNQFEIDDQPIILGVCQVICVNTFPRTGLASLSIPPF